jgi:CRP-like cAMP-binding protein
VHLAVMSKENFQTILKNKVRKGKLEQMDVLQSLPFFRVWTKTQLLKVVNFLLEPKQFIKNQIVYSEGDPSQSIFIIRKGDFEVQKRYMPFDDYTYNPNKIVN